jgi:CheY-like chemotaxis protein
MRRAATIFLVVLDFGAMRFGLGRGSMAVVHGPPTILVVEDDVDTRNALCEYLGYEGFAVAVARNGAEAIHLLDITSPCAMLIDLTMPGITAEQLVAYLRGLDRLADLARVISGKIVLSKERVDLLEVVREAVETVRPLIESQNTSSH